MTKTLESQATNSPSALPDVVDMVDMGMGISLALEVWHQMMNDRSKPAAYWWDVVRDVCRPDLH